MSCNINVVINKSKNTNPLLSEKSAFLSFPYNENLINYIKNLRFRFYDASNKTWEIEYKELVPLCKTFKDCTFNIADRYVEPTKPIYNLQIPTNYKFNLQPLPFQKDGIIYGLNHPKFLLADQMGLGKTLQSIYISDIESTGKVLVICCSASLKYNWVEELYKTLNREDSYVLGTRIKGKNNKSYEGTGKDKYEDLENLVQIPQKYIITNRELLLYDSHKQGNKNIFPVADKINELCQQGVISCIIVDEFHKGLKDPTTKSSKALLKITDCKYKIALTGTPVLNTPLDIYVILQWLNIINEKINFWTFKNTFAYLDDFGGYQSPKNLPQLSKLLRDNMLRREKSDQLNLPSKLYKDEYVEMGTKQTNLYNVVKRGIQDELHTMTHSTEPLAKLINLRKVTGQPSVIDNSLQSDDNAKLLRLKDLVEEIIENNEKAIIYTNWTTTANLLKTTFKKYNPAYITGEVNQMQRLNEVKKLQEDESCKLLIGDSAMGVGLTMTKATYLIFYDFPWTKGEKDQIEDRIHRIGQTKTTTIINLMCKNTIDEGIYQLVEKKGRMADYVVDGRIDTKSFKNLVQALLDFGK